METTPPTSVPSVDVPCQDTETASAELEPFSCCLSLRYILTEKPARGYGLFCIRIHRSRHVHAFGSIEELDAASKHARHDCCGPA